MSLTRACATNCVEKIISYTNHTFSGSEQGKMCYLWPVVPEGNPVVHSPWTDIDENPWFWLIQTHKEGIEEVD